MNSIAEDLRRIKGLKHAYLQLQGYDAVSTFPSDRLDSMAEVASLAEQYFYAAKSINRPYNEITFSLEGDENLIAYQIDENALVVLLSEQRINMPQVHMTMRIVVKKIREGIQLEANTTKTAPDVDVATSSARTIVEEKPSAEPVAQQQNEAEMSEPAYMIYRGQKIYKDNQGSTKKKNEKPSPKMVYRGQKI